MVDTAVVSAPARDHPGEKRNPDVEEGEASLGHPRNPRKPRTSERLPGGLWPTPRPGLTRALTPPAPR